MRIAITGATGFIGQRLVERLLRSGHEISILTREAKQANKQVRSYRWNYHGEPAPPESLEGCAAVIHLAGEPVAQRWNDEVEARIRESRVTGTRHLVDSMARLQKRPGALVSASAIGFYGDRGDEVLTENSPAGTGFLADVCRGWEAEADRAATFGVRVAKLRIGIVLGKEGGALKQMLPLFRAGIGGRLGSGKEWMSWIHREDVVSMFLHAAENPVQGVWNATAPHPVTNTDFTRVLAGILHRPAVLPVPRFALKLAFGEMGGHMLDSSRAIPEAPLRSGFPFQYPELEGALRNLLA